MKMNDAFPGQFLKAADIDMLHITDDIDAAVAWFVAKDS